MSERFVPSEAGKPIRIAGMPGRVRTYDFAMAMAAAMPPSASRWYGGGGSARGIQLAFPSGEGQPAVRHI
jgi:hypothetical protein